MSRLANYSLRRDPDHKPYLMVSRLGKISLPGARIASATALCAALLLGTACQSLGLSDPPQIDVILTYQKRAYQLGVLLKDYKLKARVRPRSALPYSSNASAAIWLGRDFDYKQAVKVIKLARNYYKDLRYIALSDKQPDRPPEVHKQLFIGGSTETALDMKLKAWTASDWDGLDLVKSKEALHALIKARYGN